MNWNEYFMGFARHAALKSKDGTMFAEAKVEVVSMEMSA